MVVTLYFYALWDRNIDVVKALLASGSNLALVDNQGQSIRDIARLRRIILPGMEDELPQSGEAEKY